ncbi:phosphoribosylformylglycinamidine synthase subunit PurS [Campylobacter sp. 2018MI35]|uniref:phosphoribosylformylglycinamidine synthase subunit PurS n=1 Tax=Campylobacter sp. 2018MI34 TaxID=2800582 RepID=UPI0019081026|nr:phosphoribosylformylglycinamidine synthase subunit PurS [Campylobacter sp. 2018MI34]MBK1991463.1 phosphoribosylformylglycinamidine synthase subunit PurS [Campylobacter sp. 2018MI34]
MKIVVNIFLKEGVLDPQGKTIQKALHSLNFNNVNNVKMAKQIILELNENDKTKANKEVKKMCEELLVNDVIEDYEIII